jgi:hypothetical protein
MVFLGIDGVGGRRFKVKMIVISAIWIEERAALRTLLSTGQIVANRKLVPAHAAKYCWPVPLGGRPGLNHVISQGVVAVFARKVETATLHLDRDYIDLRIIVGTSGLRVDIHTVNFGGSGLHALSGYKRG